MVMRIPHAPIATAGPVARKVFLPAGDVATGATDTVITTVLGSCIAVCLVDVARRRAGMNHFVLPKTTGSVGSLRYGEDATVHLIRLMESDGSRRHHLQAKVFGGGRVLNVGDTDDIGTTNARTAFAVLRDARIPVVAENTGGAYGRVVKLFCGTGTVFMRRIS